MNDDVEMIFGEPDLETNTRTVTIKVPVEVDPESTKKMFYNAVWSGARKIEEENK